MSMITLRGPSTQTTVTGDETNFERFMKWLREYNPATSTEDYYPLRTDNRVIQCRIKARKLGLNATQK